MGGHLNLDGGTLTLDRGTRPPYNLSTDYNPYCMKKNKQTKNRCSVQVTGVKFLKQNKDSLLYHKIALS